MRSSTHYGRSLVSHIGRLRHWIIEGMFFERVQKLGLLRG